MIADWPILLVYTATESATAEPLWTTIKADPKEVVEAQFGADVDGNGGNEIVVWMNDYSENEVSKSGR